MLTDKIRRLLSANRLEEAFDLLLAITKVRDAKTHDQLVLLLSSHNANTIRSQLGTINFEQARIEQNKIVSALLRILGRVEQSEYTSGLEEAVLLKKMDDEDQPQEKILFVAANPQGTAKLQLEKEYIDLRRIFRKKLGELYRR